MKVRARIKLIVEAQNASFSSGNIAPTLGQFGINIKQFCEQFNNRTKHIIKGVELNTRINVFTDNNFEIQIKTPSINKLLWKCATDNRKEVSIKAIYEIARLLDHSSRSDISTKPRFVGEHIGGIPRKLRSIIGTARSMNLTIIR